MLINEQWIGRAAAATQELSAGYQANGYAIIPGLLSDDALNLMHMDTARLLTNSIRKDFAMECMGGSSRRMRTLGAPIIDALSTLVPYLYYSAELLSLVEEIVGQPVYALYEDIDRYVLNALTEPGDTFGAHYDDYPLSLVLVLDVAPAGGRPRLLANAANVLDVMDQYQELTLAVGDAYVLRSDTTAHYVSPLGPTGQRIAFNLAYALTPQATGGTESPTLLYSRIRSGEVEAPVCSYTEWDPLEEVIVGVATGTIIPRESERMIRSTMPDEWHDLFLSNGGLPFPQGIVEAAQAELDDLAALLSSLGVTVRRPDSVDWAALGGHTSAMPRDCLLVVGTSLIEAPMVWRSRQKESTAYRSILTSYAERGARWVSAPRTDPCVLDAVHGRWAITNDAPAFDGADFLRVGRDVVGQLSHVTNMAGVNWLRSYLGPEYTVTILEFDDPRPMHIDATIMPLRPGLLLVNGERVSERVLDRSPFARWEKIVVQKPRRSVSVPRYMTSGWLNMNVLSAGPGHVIVEAGDDDVACLLDQHGLEVTRLPFEHVAAIGGSFHCATADIRRRGTRESYV